MLFLVGLLALSVNYQNGQCASIDDFMSDEIQCQCVPPHLCDDSDKAANGHELLDIRFEDDSCPNHFDICCENVKNTSTVVKNIKCGLSNVRGVGPRITSDSEITQFGELPWIVLVFDSGKTREKNAFMCGGSLIHPRVVLTAAHCVSSIDPEFLKVRAGEWNIKTTNEPFPHQDQDVEDVLVHPQYKPSILWNDVALLFLKEPFTRSEHIGFVCLPSKQLQVNDKQCVASGWGKKALLRSRHASILRKVSVPIVSKNKCQAALRTTRLGKMFRLHRSFICAGGERNKDTCKGDGGSPLSCPLNGESDRFVQMGIVSWGIGCGTNRTPGVYANLPVFIEWIDKQMKSRNLSTTYYKV